MWKKLGEIRRAAGTEEGEQGGATPGLSGRDEVCIDPRANRLARALPTPGRPPRTQGNPGAPWAGEAEEAGGGGAPMEGRREKGGGTEGTRNGTEGNVMKGNDGTSANF